MQDDISAADAARNPKDNPTSENSPTVNRVDAESFLSALDPAATFFTFLTFDDNYARKDKSLTLERNSSLGQIWNKLADLNRRGAGIFVTINQTDGKGRAANNVKRIRALFIDLDGTPLPDAFHVRPHVVVESSPGKWHCYWLVTNCTREQFTALQRRLVRHYNSDPKIIDPSRVMRLPGFVHQKVDKDGHRHEPSLTRVAEAHDHDPYEVEAFVEGLSEDGSNTDSGAAGAREGNGAAEPNAWETFGASQSEYTPPPWSFAEEAKLRSALAKIPTDEQILNDTIPEGSHKVWVNAGRGLERLGWGERGKAIWRDWSRGSPKFDEKGLHTNWASFQRTRDSAEPGKRVTVERIYQYAAAFDIAEAPADKSIDKSTDTPTGSSLLVSSAAFVAGFTPPDYLIDGLLQRRFFYSFTGPTGSGKTAIALRVALHVATGKEIGDRQVERGKVLFFAGENPDDVRMRWIKLCEETGRDPADVDVHFLPGAAAIGRDKIRKRIVDEVNAIGPVSLVIVDTSAAYFTGDDENSNSQAGNHARMLRSLVDLTGGPTVIVTCHPTKTPNMDNLLPRGGGAFIAEVDGNLICAQQPNSMVSEVHWHGKLRGADFAPIPFQLVTGTTDKLMTSGGRPLWTVTARPMTEQQHRQAEEAARADEDDLLVVMRSNPDLSSLTEFGRKLGWTYSDGHTPNKTRVHRSLQALKAAGLVDKKRGRWTVTKAGTNAPASKSKPQGKML